jgi:hypothetical protein
MYNDSSKTLAVIAFTKIIKNPKKQNNFCASRCNAVQGKIFYVRCFASTCMSEKLFFKYQL